MSLLNQELYAARWLWDRAKESDEWSETQPCDDNGTSVRAAGDVLSGPGHVDWESDYDDDNCEERRGYTPAADNGIARFRSAQSVEEVHTVLANDKADRLGAVPFLNSWGRGYPHRTWMPDDVLDQLMKQQGEVAIPTDR